MTTPKQVLKDHIAAMHRRRPSVGLTFSDLQRWHANQHHHHHTLNHYHEGVNLGPGTRPIGWYTGEDAVLLK